MNLPLSFHEAQGIFLSGNYLVIKKSLYVTSIAKNTKPIIPKYYPNYLITLSQPASSSYSALQ